MSSAPTITPPLDPTLEAAEPRRLRGRLVRSPQPARLRARLTSPGYAVRAPLLAWLQTEATRAGELYGRYRVLDVGCGQKPYLPFFAPFTDRYVGVDTAFNGFADVVGPADAIPVTDGSFDVVLCTQVLEHVSDPARVVRELRRVVAPGGRVLLSTHGVQVYHPSPQDLWRWTHTGLEQLFHANGTWSSVSVVPASGSAACIGMLMGTYLDLMLKQLRLRVLARPVVALINATARLVDRLSGRAPRPGTIHANYHVVAQA